MSADVNVIWRKGDGDMPEKVKQIAEEAKDELLLRSLHLPLDVIDTIRHNAIESDLTVSDYISGIILGHIKVLT